MIWTESKLRVVKNELILFNIVVYVVFCELYSLALAF